VEPRKKDPEKKEISETKSPEKNEFFDFLNKGTI